MDRISLTKFYENGVFNFLDSKDVLDVVLSGEEIDEISLEIRTEENASINLLILNLKENTKINFNLSKNSKLRIECLFSNEHKFVEITANLMENAEIEGFFADFSKGDFVNKVDIHLLERGSKARWKVASLSSKKDNKKFDISLCHHYANTYGYIDNYGVSKDDGKLLFSGISHILKNSKNSITRQNAKIMVFDRYSNAIAKPILKIDENEIEASHAASVGKISDDEMFYLTSRGLSEEMAKELITLGYLKPIVSEFKDDDVRESILKLIEERM